MQQILFNQDFPKIAPPAMDQDILLGNSRVQMPEGPLPFDKVKNNERSRIDPRFGIASMNARLLALKSKHFTKEGREERVRKSLDALRSKQTLVIPFATWRWIMEDPEAEEQD